MVSVLGMWQCGREAGSGASQEVSAAQNATQRRLAPCRLTPSCSVWVISLSHTYTQTTFKFLSVIPAIQGMLWPHSFIRGRRQGQLSTEWAEVTGDPVEQKFAGGQQGKLGIKTGLRCAQGPEWWLQRDNSSPSHTPSKNKESNGRVTSDPDRSVVSCHDLALYLLIFPFPAESLSLREP